MPRYTAKVFVASGDAIRGFAIPHPNIVTEVTEALTYEVCDIAVVYGAPRSRGRDPKKIAIRNSIYSEHKGPLIVVETGFIGRKFTKRPFSRIKSFLGIYHRNRSDSPYLRVGLGGAFGDDGNFCNENSPRDRWERLQREFGLSIKPWRETGRHVLLIGQVPNDSSLKGADINQWLVDTIRELGKHTDRPVEVRLHPRTIKEEAVPVMRAIRSIGAALSDPKEPIWSDLEQCWACVTFSSSACVESLLAGVPPICTSPASIGYPISSNHVSDIEKPKIPDDREQWFSNLAYAQWSTAEMASGRAWRHLEAEVMEHLAG